MGLWIQMRVSNLTLTLMNLEMGSPHGSTDPNESFQLYPNFDEFGDYAQRTIETLNILDNSSQHLITLPTIRQIDMSSTPNPLTMRS